MKVYVTATGWITHPDRQEAVGVELFERELVGDEMPCQIGVYCDGCGEQVVGDYVVHESMPQGERFEVARAGLRTQGWKCDRTGDYCPTCKADIEAQR